MASYSQWFTWMETNCAMPVKQRKLLASYLIASTMIFAKPHGKRKYNKRSFLEMESGEKDLTKRIRRNRYVIPFIGHVCCSFFRWYWILGKFQVHALIAHLKLGKSVSPPSHKHSAKPSNNSLSQSTYTRIDDFLLEIERDYGEPVATRSYKQSTRGGKVVTRVELDNQILLPSFFSLRTLHSQLNERASQLPLSLTSFVRYWKSSKRFKQMHIRTPAKDICDNCTILKGQLKGYDGQNRYNTASEANERIVEIESDLNLHRKEYREC